MNLNEISEELLDAWLYTTARISNDRIVEGLTFNEAFVCNILSKNRDDEKITATFLCNQTGIQKSQMNKILNSLEKINLVIRERSVIDKRNVYISLNLENEHIFNTSHNKSIELVKRLINEMGVESSQKLTELLNEVTKVFVQLYK